MMRNLYSNRRLLIVLLLLCATVLAQSTALAAQNESHHSPDHCCLLCHVGPLPFLQTSVSASLAPVFQVVWMAPAWRVLKPPPTPWWFRVPRALLLPLNVPPKITPASRSGNPARDRSGICKQNQECFYAAMADDFGYWR